MMNLLQGFFTKKNRIILDFVNTIKREGIYLVKFNSENGPIKKGDIVTTSSEPGVAMKATESGMIIGIALEDANGESGLVKIRILIQYVK